MAPSLPSPQPWLLSPCGCRKRDGESLSQHQPGKAASDDDRGDQAQCCVLPSPSSPPQGLAGRGHNQEALPSVLIPRAPEARMKAGALAMYASSLPRWACLSLVLLLIASESLWTGRDIPEGHSWSSRDEHERLARWLKRSKLGKPASKLQREIMVSANDPGEPAPPSKGSSDPSWAYTPLPHSTVPFRNAAGLLPRAALWLLSTWNVADPHWHGLSVQNTQISQT